MITIRIARLIAGLNLDAVGFVRRVFGGDILDLPCQPHSAELVKVLNRDLFAVAFRFNIRSDDHSSERVVVFGR